MTMQGAPDIRIEPASGQRDGVRRPAALSVIVPTFNESNNVPILVERLSQVLAGIDWEVIFVDDDSPDGTADTARRIAGANHRVRCIRRIGRRGLAGACIEGMLASSADIVAVMDGDLQHDEKLLPRMYETLRSPEVDLVTGSRFVVGGSAEQGLSSTRRQGSAFAIMLAQKLLRVELTDPMSGFFMIRRAAFEAVAPRLSTRGFKILLDIVTSSRETLRVVELPFAFGARMHGESKLDNMVTFEYLAMLLVNMSGRRVSVPFVLFAAVGATALIVHLLALKFALGFAAFAWAQAIAALAALTWSFLLGNHLNYRDRRLYGMRAFAGLLKSYATGSVSVIASVGVGVWVYGMPSAWWIAGGAGAIVGLAVNYAVTAALAARQG